MDINRDNYEEYFLMYADNELTDSEKAELLLFLRDHKDLEAEFRMILKTVATPAEIRLEHKDFLYKAQSVKGIRQDNYEEFFVQFHDGELSGTLKEDTLTFLNANLHLKATFDQLGSARLQPNESTVFEEKQVLYRNEPNVRVIRPILWTLLSAAVIAGLGWWVLARYTERVQIIPEVKFQVAKNTLHQGPVSKDSGTGKETGLATHPQKLTHAPGRTTQDRGAHLKTPAQVLPGRIGMGKENLEAGSIAAGPLKEMTGVPRTANILKPGPLDRARTLMNLPDRTPAPHSLPPSSNQLATATKDSVTNGGFTSTAAGNAQLQNSSDPNQDYVFYDVSESQFSRTKMGGFIKKMRRIIHRSNPINRIFEGNEQP